MAVSWLDSGHLFQRLPGRRYLVVLELPLLPQQVLRVCGYIHFGVQRQTAILPTKVPSYWRCAVHVDHHHHTLAHWLYLCDSKQLHPFDYVLLLRFVCVENQGALQMDIDAHANDSILYWPRSGIYRVVPLAMPDSARLAEYRVQCCLCAHSVDLIQPVLSRHLQKETMNEAPQTYRV